MADDAMTPPASPASPGAAAPPQLVYLDARGELTVDWEMAERFAQCWDLGVRDHPGVLWAKILVRVRDQVARVDKAVLEKLMASGRPATPRLKNGPPPKIGDNNSWKPIGWEQLSRAVDELKDPGVIGLAVVILRSTPEGLESLQMWSASVAPSFIHSALTMAAEDIAAGFRSERGVPGQPVPPLN